MRIYDLMTNRVVEPLGYAFGAPRFSYKCDQTQAATQAAARIRIATDADMKALVFDSGKSDAIDNLCYAPDIKLAPYTRYYWDVTVWADNGDTATSAPTWFETAKLDEAWTANWISAFESIDGNQNLHKTFETDKQLVAARAYICGLGLYELYINGEKAGDEYLAPDCNAYDQWIQYQTYDVTGMLKSGKNDLCVMLGDGWYKGRFGFQTKDGKTYGDKQALIMELRLTYADGTVATIVSDESWTATESKVRFANIYDGEYYDATFSCDKEYPVKTLDLCKCKLTARLSQPVRVTERIAPKEIIHTPAGETVIDLGQEISGWLEFKTSAPRGTELKLSYFEILQKGNFYRDNLRSALEEYSYICDGTEQVVRPRFTFYGFRYIKLEGFTDVNLADFTGCVIHSDIKRLIEIDMFNDKLNRFAANALWGQRGNFVDVPTDCPQRDERMGWTGDAQAFSGTACFNMESAAFFRKFIYDMMQEQKARNGAVPHVIPAFKLGGDPSCAWADAATIIPWNTYMFYGDKKLLEEQYPCMKDWAEWIYRKDEETGGLRLWHVGFHFADWLALDTENGTPIGGTDSHYVASAFYYYSVGLTLKAAKALGYAEDVARYTKLEAEIRDALQKEYFTPGGRLGESTQTAYILALFMHFAPEQFVAKLSKLLADKFEASDGKLRTGFVGTSYLNRTLSEFGMNDLAYKLLLNEEYPGWLYEVNMGATTVWERWNSVLPDGSISDTGMNSLNHYAYGAVMEWVYRDVCGLNPCECHPGFKKAFIRPRPSFRLPKVELKYDSAMGLYEVGYEISKNKFDMHVTVPFNASAKCVLPYGDMDALKAAYPQLTFAADGDDVSCELSAGKYAFTYKPTQPLHFVYSLDTPLGMLMDDPEKWAAMSEIIPAFKKAGEQQIGRKLTPRMLEHHHFAPITGEEMDKLKALLDEFNK